MDARPQIIEGTGHHHLPVSPATAQSMGSTADGRTEAVAPRRHNMPEPEQAEQALNLWSVLKGMVGSKEILSLPLPAETYLPLSELQKQAEEAEYSELLDKAAACPKGSVERMEQVVAFSVSSYSSCQRPMRSLNPLLSETFEFVYPEKGMRLISEHVRRLPGVMVQCVEGRGWVLESESEPHVSLGMGYVDLNMNFYLQVTFADGDIYSWHKVRTAIQNIIMGQLYVEHTGVYRVSNHLTGLTAVMELVKPKPLLFSAKMRKAGQHMVKGHLEQDGRKLQEPTFSGKWSESLSATAADGAQRQLWQVNDVPANRWLLSKYVIHAAEMTPGLQEKLPPTDSRLRRDLHLLERAVYNEANNAKLELEELDRAYCAALKAARPDKAPIAPHFFELVAPQTPAGKGLRWRYRQGSYWEAREQADWATLPHIFGGVQ